jgi:Flp pilus assembly protein TadD
VKLTTGQKADIQVARGRSLEKDGSADQAAVAYQEALKLDPQRADAYQRLARLRDQEGKFKESEELFQKALSLQPGCADIFCDMGYSLYLQHRWAEAEMNLRQAIALAPNHERAHNNLGLVLARAGRTEDALAEFYKGGCSEADARVNVAYVLTLENEWPEARRHYETALAAEPGSSAAKKGLQEINQLLTRALATQQEHQAPGDLQPASGTSSPAGVATPVTPR